MSKILLLGTELNGVHDVLRTNLEHDAPKLIDFGDNIMLQIIDLEQIPAKLNDFADKDLLQHIDLARVLFGGMSPSRRDAR